MADIGVSVPGDRTRTRLPPRFSPWDPAVARDPYPLYATLRAAGPVARAGPGVVAVTKHAEVTALLRDPRLGHTVPPELARRFSTSDHQQEWAAVTAASRPNLELPRLVSALDAADHHRVRHLLNRVVQPSRLREVWSAVEPLLQRRLSELLRAGSADAVAELVEPVQLEVSARLVGVPAEELRPMLPCISALGRAIITVPFVDPVLGNGEAEARRLKGWMSDRLSRPRGSGDGVHALVADGMDDRLTWEEAVTNAVFLLFAGFDTTMQVMCVALQQWADQPDLVPLICADPARTVEETLRFDSPLQWVTRVTSAATPIGDRTIPAGRFVLLLLGSANRDADVFDEADQWRPSRHPNPHVSFGGGPHHCLGVQLARLVCRGVLVSLAERRIRLGAAGPASGRPHPVVRGFRQLPLTFSAPG